MERHTPLSRLGVVAACLLAGSLAHLGAGEVTTPYLVVPLTAASVTALVFGHKMARDNCFESRLVCSLTALACLGGALAAATIGLPGREPHVAPAGVLMTVAAVTFLLVVAVEAPRRFRAGPAAAPYAP